MEFHFLNIYINQILCFFFLTFWNKHLNGILCNFLIFLSPKIKFSLNRLCTFLQHSLLFMVGLTSDPHVHNGQILKTTPTNMIIKRIIWVWNFNGLNLAVHFYASFSFHPQAFSLRREVRVLAVDEASL